MVKLVGVSELAAMLKCHGNTVRRLARHGIVSSVRVGSQYRFNPEVVLKQLERAKR